MFNRSSGLLAHITMLPGPYGCGTFGKESRIFVDMLRESGFSWWQVLPLGHPDLGNSPYTAFSAFALNPLLADPGLLAAEGLLTPYEEEAARWSGQEYWVDFDSVLTLREKTLRTSFTRVTPEMKEQIQEFVKKEEYWLPDYALFMTLVNKQGDADWTKWPEGLAHRDKAAMKEAAVKYKEEIDYHIFVQWILAKQWKELHTYANSHGIQILGDMPIYPSFRSADLWSHPELFQIEDGKLTKVAGCPPDFFNADGQLWGNPLYDWDAMDKDGYKWWLARIGNSLETYDAVRIDHFRGFSAYWAIPAEDDTAKNGKWVKGPGMKLFSKVKEFYPDANILAEDLGVLDDDVYKLIEDTGYPGMRVMQFAFAPNNEPHLPHNYPVNVAAYTGTHDNNTILGYFYEVPEWERDYACRYIGLTDKDAWAQGGRGAPLCRAVARCLWQSQAALTIIPYQDVAGWGRDTRFNRPGVATGNWNIRITWESLGKIDRGWYWQLNKDFSRI